MINSGQWSLKCIVNGGVHLQHAADWSESLLPVMIKYTQYTCGLSSHQETEPRSVYIYILYIEERPMGDLKLIRAKQSFTYPRQSAGCALGWKPAGDGWEGRGGPPSMGLVTAGLSVLKAALLGLKLRCLCTYSWRLMPPVIICPHTTGNISKINL